MGASLTAAAIKAGLAGIETFGDVDVTLAE
jgi:hypothetical protein